jgi:hypothetical protein
MSLHLVPMNLENANSFVALWHRHHAPVLRSIFQVGVADDDTLVGVAICEWPKARGNADGATIEISRCAVADGVRNAASMLYRACVSAAFALGWRRVITYTRQDESGASLRGAAFRVVAARPARTKGQRWTNRAGRTDRESVPRYLWEASA